VKLFYQNVVSPYICIPVNFLRGSSSVGRAAASQAAGRGFEPRLPLRFKNLLLAGFLILFHHKRKKALHFYAGPNILATYLVIPERISYLRGIKPGLLSPAGHQPSNNWMMTIANLIITKSLMM
jgi:hypothetical protein